jgi:hypothetical protein
LIAGLVIAVIGLIGMFSSGEDDDPIAAATTTTTAVEPGSITSPPAPTTTTTTLPPPTTTTTEILATTTTSAIDEKALIDSFVIDFAAAIGNRDVEFLFDTLHPAVLGVFSEDVCRAFIQDEILLLQEYRLTGDLTGPASESIGGITFESYRGPVAFTFQGQNFDAQAAFAVENTGPTWFGECADSG